MRLAACLRLLSAAHELSLDDCNVVKLGCWQDSKPGDTSPGATGKRLLPYSWCPQGAVVKGQTKTPDNTYEGHHPPPCHAEKMTPRVCADACLQWIGAPQASKAFTVWSGVEWTQECWCGDADPTLVQSKRHHPAALLCVGHYIVCSPCGSGKC